MLLRTLPRLAPEHPRGSTRYMSITRKYMRRAHSTSALLRHCMPNFNRPACPAAPVRGPVQITGQACVLHGHAPFCGHPESPVRVRVLRDFIAGSGRIIFGKSRAGNLCLPSTRECLVTGPLAPHALMPSAVRRGSSIVYAHANAVHAAAITACTHTFIALLLL